MSGADSKVPIRTANWSEFTKAVAEAHSSGLAVVVEGGSSDGTYGAVAGIGEDPE